MQKELIRQVNFRLTNAYFRLYLYDTFKDDSMGKRLLGYKLTMRIPKYDTKHTTVFEGADIACSPLHAIDSDNAVKAVMGFLTLRKGDVESDYFENYNDIQKDFRDTYAESLSMEVLGRFGE
jgi:hypothetical protein